MPGKRPFLFKKLIVATLLSVALFLVVPHAVELIPVAHAADALSGDELFGGPGSTGTSFASEIGLGSSASLMEMIVRLIRTALGFLGIIAVCFVIYGGFKYMTSGGETKRVEDAKKIITNALIGMVIILFSFAIVQFILGVVVGAGSNGGINGGGGGGGGGGAFPPGGGSSLYLSSVNTECSESLRNLQLQMVFTQTLDAESLSRGLSVTKAGIAVDGTVAVRGTLVTFTPSAACPDPNGDQKCFDANSDYRLVLDPAVVHSISNKPLKCTAQLPCSFDFTTGNAIDLVPPTLTMTAPNPIVDANVYVGRPELLQADTNDDVGVSTVNFYLIDDEVPLFVSGLDLSSVKDDGTVTFSSDILREWNTSGYTPNRDYPLWAGAQDCAGHSAVSPRISVTMRAATCLNGVLDLNEAEIDCGGDRLNENYCGACDAQVCEENAECASGLCENGVCVPNTYITQISPGDGALTNLITIKGKGFGQDPGQVTFLGSDAQNDEAFASGYECNGGSQWSDTEIVIQVPEGAIDGPLELRTADEQPAKTDRTDDLVGPYFADFDVNQIKRPGICSLNPLTSTAGVPVVISGQGFGESRGNSTVYFSAFEPSAYTQRWSETESEVVVPNADAGRYPVQLFTGDFFCVQADGVVTDNACESNENCNQAEGERCATSWCSETLAFCNETADCGADGGRCESIRVGSNTRTFVLQDPNRNLNPTISHVESGWKVCEGGNNGGDRCGRDADCGGNGAVCVSAPDWGPVGQYVTIYGTNFGSDPSGFVYFEDPGNQRLATGATDFPAYCNSDFWSDTSITVKVPAKYNNSEDAIAGMLHRLYVHRNNVDSNKIDFQVRTGEGNVPGPALCGLSPVSGPVGTLVTLRGENFGAQKGDVQFFDNQVPADQDVLVWTNSQITDAESPAESQSGPVRVIEQASGYTSNPINFNVGDCREDSALCEAGQQCCANGSCNLECNDGPKLAHLSYHISTGPIPRNPIVYNHCGDDFVSATPSNQFSESRNICLNAKIEVAFGFPYSGNVPEFAEMDQSTFSDGILVEHCTQNAATRESCQTWEPVLGEVPADEDSVSSFTWSPIVDFLPNGIYRVTIKGGDGAGALSTLDGGHLENDFRWTFQTSADLAHCEVGAVNVMPPLFTATEDAGYDYLAQLVAKNDRCVSLRCNSPNEEYSIGWQSDQEPNAHIARPNPDLGVCSNVVDADHETPLGDPAGITAQVTNVPDRPADTGLLTIDYADPTVVNYFPNCEEACKNVQPFVVFSKHMNKNSVEQNIVLKECLNSTCDPMQLRDLPFQPSFIYTEDGLSNTSLVVIDFQEERNQLTPNKWYRVVLAGNAIRSASGVPLSSSGSNFGSDMNLYASWQHDFSWKFKTKVSDVTCQIDSILVAPPIADVKIVGTRQEFRATAHGEPDECSVIGQALQDSDFTWNPWSATDKRPEKVPATPQDVAFMLGAGSVALADALPAYCSSSCLNLGSSITVGTGICGNRVIDAPSEECDNGDTVDGDGCSSHCLLEGTARCANPADNSCCGNGRLDANEQCDDQNLNGNDGCNTQCLNRGTTGIRGAICGDGVRDHSPLIGGEDCDDGNALAGDGCSAQCLSEGSVANARVYATCGNGILESGEDCEDEIGQINPAEDGDGCSARCLNEGTRPCAAGAVGCCGNRQVERGEDCDDGNLLNGDSCSSACLFEGASAYAPIPSYCGDGITKYNNDLINDGEECEAIAGSVKKVRGYGVAQVGVNASVEVDEATHYATSQIAVSTTQNNKLGNATVRLQCSCQSDSACGSPNTVGCGNANCCYGRPEIDEIVPAIGQNNLCRNTRITVNFTEVMDEATFGEIDADKDGRISGAEFKGNISLKLVRKPNARAVMTDVSADHTLCPEAYVQTAYATGRGTVLARAWGWVKQTVLTFFGQSAIAQVAPPFECLVPLKYVTVIDADKSQVTLEYSQALEANAVYELKIKGDENINDAIVGGVLSANKVGINGTWNQQLNIGADICVLDTVTVVDNGKVGAIAQYETRSPNYFSRKDEEHSFVATPYTTRPGGGLESIIEIANVYSWHWSWGTSFVDRTQDSIVYLKPGDAQDLTSKSILAEGHDGQETVTASATIDNGIQPAGSVSGSTEVFGLMCENPWPTIGRPFPFKEIDKKTNFSLFYCRDQGEEGIVDDLPELTDPPIYAANTDFLQEMFFKVSGTKDAIGVRVIRNPKYLSPEKWFEEQKFIGTASSTTLDGYPAVLSGNTIYVAAANVEDVGRVIHSNIYAISYNPDAGEVAKEIFKRALTNLRFNANSQIVSNVRLCKVGNSYVSREGSFFACTWDGQCVEHCKEGVCAVSGGSCTSDSDCLLRPAVGATPGAVCDAEKDKLRRDTKRLFDVKDFSEAMNNYGSEHSRCSVTKERICRRDTDCPGEGPVKEICVKTFPIIQEGTFIPSKTMSKWPSWSSQLGLALGTSVLMDPINEFYDQCSALSGYESSTCWNAQTSMFVCPTNSKVYGFQSKGEEYNLFGQIEYPEYPWASRIDPRVCEDGQTLCMDNSDCVGIGSGANLGRCGINLVRDKASIHMEYTPARSMNHKNGFVKKPSFCAGTEVGISAVCGDGIRGQGEECEVGDIKSLDCARGANQPMGTINITCKTDTCKWQSAAEAGGAGAVCQAPECGNGTKEGREICDDGDLNGTYGHCGVDCTYSGQGGNAFFCGDGYLAGPEECDCGNNVNHGAAIGDNQSWASANDDAGEACQVSNGQYGKVNLDRFTSCSFDCKLSGPHCGDREVNGSEQCDGDFVEWGGGLCDDGLKCVTDEDCGANNGTCGSGEDTTGVDGVCPRDNGGYEQVRSRSCTPLACTWNEWSGCHRIDTQSCGNGQIDGSEACDDGNDLNTDACKNSCQLNVCGDGQVNIGVESCDRGNDNNVLCTPLYGQSCNYCTNTCQYKTVGGTYCGDGVINGNEMCDGNQLRLSCIDEANGFVKIGECALGRNPNARCGGPNNNAGFCKDAGVCNGGSDSGTTCYSDAGCPNGGSDNGLCIKPVCAPNCLASCPFDFKTTSLLVQSEVPGATPTESVDLHSYLNVAHESPDNAVLYIPACTVATEMYADVSDDNVVRPNVDVVFVTDLSGSMGDGVGGGLTKIQVASEATAKAIDKLYNAYANQGSSKMRIGLVSFTAQRGWHDSGTEPPADPASPCTTPLRTNGRLPYVETPYPCDKLEPYLLEDSTENRLALKERVTKYTEMRSWGTPTYQGIDMAIDILNDAPAENVKIIILLSDGNPITDLQVNNLDCMISDQAHISPCVDQIRGLMNTQVNRSIKFYSAGIVSSYPTVGYMSVLSDEICEKGGNNLYGDANDCGEGTYAFHGTTASQIKGMYDEIMTSILGMTTTVSSADANDHRLVSDPKRLQSGIHIQMPFPDAFVCKPEPTLMPLTTEFLGTGSVNFTNFSFTYCPVQ